MNAGLRRLLDEGCEKILLLNNDAELEPGCLSLLAQTLDDPTLAAVGPVIVRAHDGRVESRGIDVETRWGRVRLRGQGAHAPERSGIEEVAALSGAVVMLSRVALERVGLLDEAYFFSFEDVDWCLRARQSGLRVAVVLDARARHVGSLSLGRVAPERFYYATRNHLRVVESRHPLTGPARWLRRAAVLALNLGHALRQGEASRRDALRAVLTGFSDACHDRSGPRPRGPATGRSAEGEARGPGA
jgi:GT2 family glycosyltransferase